MIHALCNTLRYSAAVAMRSNFNYTRINDLTNIFIPTFY